MSNVLLLRAPSQDQPDPYESYLKKLDFYPLCVPVLETVFTNFNDLKRIIVDGPQTQGLAGVIITSVRACEAWGNALKDIVTETSSVKDGTDQAGSWSSVPFYVVGEASAANLQALSESYDNSPFAPKDIRGGLQAGTSERLAHFILDDLPDRGGNKLLYLTGDKNRDTLPKIIEGGDVRLQSLKVYETQGSSSFANDLRVAMMDVPTERIKWWIVFFAPSAAEFVTPILRQSFNLPEVGTDKIHSTKTTRLAAIGPTTSDFIQTKLNLQVAVCSSRPTPEALAMAIKDSD